MPDLGLNVLLKGKNMARLLGGLWVALRISLLSVAISIPLGILLGVLMSGKNPVVKAILRVYLEIIRIMPQMVLLFLVYFGTTRAFGWNLSGETASIIVFVLWGTAEMSDLVRGALIAIPKHQYESAEALGMSRAQTYWYIIIPCALVTAVTVPMLYSVALAAVKDRKPAAKDFTLGLRYAPRAIGLHLLLAVYESLPIIGATLLTSLLANILSWHAYWLLQIVSVIAGVVAVVWTVLIAVSCHAVRYRFVLDPDSGVWDTFKHAREDMNDWRFDLLMTILPIALWHILCLAAQTALVLYAGMLGRVLAEVLPVPILAYAIMTLLLTLDDIDTPEEAETAAPKEA